MKKNRHHTQNLKRIILHRETIIHLTSMQLGRAAGGAPTPDLSFGSCQEGNPACLERSDPCA